MELQRIDGHSHVFMENHFFLIRSLFILSSFRGVTEARITYFIIFGIVFNAHTTYRNTLSGSQSMGRRTVFFVHLQTAWTLMMLLLYKPHNIPLVLLITIMEVCLRHVIIQCKDGLPAWAFTLVYVWMGNATFFLQVITFISIFSVLM